MPVANPVEYTYTSPDSNNTGSTASSIPHPSPISRLEHVVAGIKTLTYGLAELPSSCDQVAILWLLHPRLQTQECMAPFAAQFIHTWNALPTHKRGQKGLIAVSFDQRNHGSRLISPVTNEAWRSGNERHAQDMFSCYHGTAIDTSQLLDHIGSYIFPDRNSPCIIENIVLGISLGGHASWHVLMQDPRFSSAIIVIGCPDYTRVMSDRARLSKRASYMESDPPGSTFIASPDFPPALVEAVAQFDPAGLILGTLLRISPERVSRPEESRYSDLTDREIDALRPILQRSLYGKRILNLSGGADKLVPYEMGRPFLDWLKGVTATRNDAFGDANLILEDIVVDGVGHEVPPSMVEHMQRFLIETLESNTAVVQQTSRGQAARGSTAFGRGAGAGRRGSQL